MISNTLVDKDAVQKRFEPDILDEEQSKIAFGDQLSKQEKDAIPRKIIVNSHGIKLPEIIGWGLGPWFFSKSIKEFIESIEPGVHEFIPIDVQLSKERTVGETYYLLLLGQSIEAVNFEQTRFRKGFGSEGAIKSAYFVHPEGPCVLHAPRIQGKHLWRGVEHMALRYFCSDELGDYLLTHKARGWFLLKCEVSN
jgi:hypothetical protein